MGPNTFAGDDVIFAFSTPEDPEEYTSESFAREQCAPEEEE